MMLEKLRRETLAEKAAAGLMEYIRESNLQPGEALPAESMLSAEFGVSRQVIREALKSLQGKGVIEIINGKGALIRDISSETLLVFFEQAVHLNQHTLIELLEVRKGIEVQSATLAAQRRTAVEIEQMSAIVAEMDKYLYEPDIYIDLDLQFHLSIANATHNTMMRHLVDSIQEASKATISEGLHRRQTKQELERVQLLHEALLTAIIDGNPEQAARVMAQQMDEPMKLLIESSHYNA